VEFIRGHFIFWSGRCRSSRGNSQCLVVEWTVRDPCDHRNDELETLASRNVSSMLIIG